VLLSIKPKYADLILSGTKRVELRRSWPSNDIGVMVLYSSAPVQRLVGAAYVETVNEENPEGLWALSQSHGGGVTHEELFEYFAGKRTAYGIMIKSAEAAERQIDPKEVFTDFVPPQSFLYLQPAQFHSIMKMMFPTRTAT
jgi:predicted transcriptional regulator